MGATQLEFVLRVDLCSAIQVRSTNDLERIMQFFRVLECIYGTCSSSMSHILHKYNDHIN